MFAGTYFISGVAERFLPYQLCCLWSKFFFFFSQTLKPRALDPHLRTRKLSAVNSSVI